jgi:NAD(P)-dependent dehydrogenase (short-subunit alcohol dehydrogenase family)
MQLEGKRALITGAGSGIGRALAVEASRLGMTVALCGRRGDALAETLSAMTPSDRHLRLRGDITDPAVRRCMRDYLWRQWGGLDVLVNNAGVIAIGPLAYATDDEFERMMATNVIAPLALTREMLPLLRRAMPSRVVNVGSMFGDIPYPLFAAYSASKFALRGLSIALRRELRGYGVGVTYAAPRATKTEAARVLDPLIEPMQMRMDNPAQVATQIWRAVIKDSDSVYATGPERLFVLIQRLLPRLIDRAIAAQMADRRVRDYLGRRFEAARARESGGKSDVEVARRSSSATSMKVASPNAGTRCAAGVEAS